MYVPVADRVLEILLLSTQNSITANQETTSSKHTQKQNKQNNTMMNKVNQNPISIDTDSMNSWDDLEVEQLNQFIDQIENSEDSVEIVGLELLFEHTHFDSEDATRISIHTPVDSLYLTRERNPGLVHIYPDARSESPARAQTKRRKSHRARSSPEDDCEDWDVDSLILTRERLSSIHNDRDRRNREKNATEKKASAKEQRQLPFKHHDSTCSNAFPDVVAMSEPNTFGFNCAA
jgi:hypothetical protein